MVGEFPPLSRSMEFETLHSGYAEISFFFHNSLRCVNQVIIYEHLISQKVITSCKIYNNQIIIEVVYQIAGISSEM